jgi:endogenous inhibitor of DNA gyrase (YacG/DUF329 family)
VSCCPSCGAPVARRHQLGREPVYCDEKCRKAQAVDLRRRRHWAWNTAYHEEWRRAIDDGLKGQYEACRERAWAAAEAARAAVKS